MASVTAPPTPEDHQNWAVWSLMALERLPLSYNAVVAILALVGIAGQIIENYLRYAQFASIQPQEMAGSVVFVVLLVYILIGMRHLQREALRGLVLLRPSVLVDDAVYEAHVARTLRASRRVELALFLLAIAIVLLLFLTLPEDMLAAAGRVQGGMFLLGIAVAGQALLGWLVLTLVYTSIRYARGLGAIARCPLTVNVFDMANLASFGRLSLVFSLSIVGLIMIPLIVLGAPQQAGYLVIGLSLLSLLALFAPLWGVRRQIVAAKRQVLVELAKGLQGVEKELTGLAALDLAQLKMLNERIDALLDLRKKVTGSPNWPFLDVGAILRASVAALSPVIYLVIDLIIQAILSPLLKSG